ncbi:hypothetical protein CBM2634_A280001 [Cupriavidus taiwanensis]|uniref:Uncharacterized protein n=1 Tax=Cupriavidus taiwanensis TaxID=164546 RepID=A0A375J030_9BURK|nr:hypothetical protein CBM2634_A280001 [Cupriavidus taiwanensis]
MGTPRGGRRTVPTRRPSSVARGVPSLTILMVMRIPIWLCPPCRAAAAVCLAKVEAQIMNHGAAADKLVLIRKGFAASSNYFVESLANPAALA